MTDDTYRWIELTDGGHSENLGLYEMVLRRCHNIVVVDAGADSECQFEDLGNALRKIEIDLGIPIRFKEDDPNIKKGAEPDNRYCAVAMIDYGCIDEHFGSCHSGVDSAVEPGPGCGTELRAWKACSLRASGDKFELPSSREVALPGSSRPHVDTEDLKRYVESEN